MKKDESLRELSDVLDYLNGIPHIDDGGCGIAALSIYRWCKKNNIKISNKPFVFLWSSFLEPECKENERNLKSNNLKELHAPNHVVIQFHKMLCDSTGIPSQIKDLFEIKQSIKLGEEELLPLINNKDEWNESFHRSNVTKIEKHLKIDLSDVKK